MSHYPLATSRRDFLFNSGAGLGAIALSSLMQGELSANGSLAPDARLPRATAKRCIFLFMEGGPSHLDTFDPKPLLNELAGQTLPESFGSVLTSMGESRSPLLASKRKWAQHGQSGLWVSDWLPETAKCVDDLAVIRSCWADGLTTRLAFVR